MTEEDLKWISDLVNSEIICDEVRTAAANVILDHAWGEVKDATKADSEKAAEWLNRLAQSEIFCEEARLAASKAVLQISF